ncbi:MAG: PadR family transcriptional regulator [Bauldia litoralis]
METKTLCLGALCLGDETGYDIKKRFEEGFGHFLDVAPSGIYRALSDLEASGSVVAERVVQDGRPNKKVYRITEQGRDELVAAMIASPARHRVRSEFLFVMIFAQMLPRAVIDGAIDRQLEEIDALIAHAESCLEEAGPDAPPGGLFVASHGLAILRAQRESLVRNREIYFPTQAEAGAPALAQ